MCSSIYLNTTTFNENYAQNGGALLLSFENADDLFQCNLNISNTTFSSNKAILNGGAINVVESLKESDIPQFVQLTIDIYKNNFIGNIADWLDTSISIGLGAVFYLKVEDLLLTVDGGEFIGNYASNGTNFYILTYNNSNSNAFNSKIILKAGIEISDTKATNQIGTIMYLRSFDEFTIEMTNSRFDL